MKEMLKNCIRPFYRFFRAVGVKLVSKVPASAKYILFESEIDFAENSRALYEYMIRQPEYADYHFVWSVKDPSSYPAHKNTVFIERDEKSIRWNYYLNRCKFFIFTHPWWLKEWKKDQVVINACHGNPFKAPPPNPIGGVFDWSVASSEEWVKYRENDFAGEFPVAVLGAPRSDYLLSKEYDQDYLSRFVDTGSFRKVIYCMPTFKKAARQQDGQANNNYSINVVSTQEELFALNEALREKGVLLVCIIHHLQTMDDMITGKLSNILYLRDEDYAKQSLVMNQMLRCADALVTDFSGVFLDYILLDRPIGFFCNDRDQYTRGFAMENPEDFMPGPHMYTMDDFLSFVDSVCEERDDYQAFRKQVRDRVQTYQDDQNCKRFLDFFKI